MGQLFSNTIFAIVAPMFAILAIWGGVTLMSRQTLPDMVMAFLMFVIAALFVLVGWTALKSAIAAAKDLVK